MTCSHDSVVDELFGDTQPVRLLAFVREPGDEGSILLWSGSMEFKETVDMAGYDISDHNMPVPNRKHGLLIFEGWIRWDPGPEPDSHLDGEWRQLTFWEISRVRFGLPPWE